MTIASVPSASPPPPPVFPPAPVTASIQLSTARLRRNQSLPDHLVLLRRQESQLHEYLQTLLCQQDEALRAVVQSSDNTKIHAAPPPIAPSLSVSVVRKSLRSAIRQLAKIKTDEATFLEKRRAANNAAIEKLAGWAKQKDDLLALIRDIERHDGHTQVATLNDETRALETEIKQLEARLLALKARRRELVLDATEIENTVQSKLSSYKASLCMLETDTNEFLRTWSTRDFHISDTSFFKIPPDRRTLDLARDHCDQEQASIDVLIAANNTEREALNEGAEMWKNVVHHLVAFENQIADSTQNHCDSIDPVAETKGLIVHLDDTARSVETHLDLAEERGWNLLVACIGAELNVLHEGRRMLVSMSREAEKSPLSTERGDVDIEFKPSSLTSEQAQQTTAPAGLVDTEQMPSVQRRRNSQCEDQDVPDPDLFISHHNAEDEQLA